MTAQARQLKQQLRSALVAGQWRGPDTALTLPLFWRRSTVSSVFFGRYSRTSLHSFVPPPPPSPSPSLISHLASVDIKQNSPVACVLSGVVVSEASRFVALCCRPCRTIEPSFYLFFLNKRFLYCVLGWLSLPREHLALIRINFAIFAITF